MASRYWYKEFVPFMAMVSAECSTVVTKTLFKAASLQGLDYQVFVFYSYALSALVLLPLSFFFHRKTVLQLPPLKFPILWRIFLLGLLGLSSQMIGYKGIEYSSPTLAAANSNLIAPFTFILAVVFRMEKLAMRSWRTRAKIMGTIVSVSGALIVILYKGPTILHTTSPTLSISSFLDQLLDMAQPNWVIGGVLLATQYVLLSFWYIFQTHILKTYPAELIVSMLVSFTVAIMSLPICLTSGRNLSFWRLRSDIATLAVIYSGFLGSALGIVTHSWAIRLKGPFYVASFRPMSIAIAAATGVVFLRDPLTIGCVLGAIIMSVGFYAVLWGKAKEDMSEECEFGSITSSSSSTYSTSKTPLLQSQNKVENI